jgi:hypothetical protein
MVASISLHKIFDNFQIFKVMTLLTDLDTRPLDIMTPLNNHLKSAATFEV